MLSGMSQICTFVQLVSLIPTVDDMCCACACMNELAKFYGQLWTFFYEANQTLWSSVGALANLEHFHACRKFKLLIEAMDFSYEAKGFKQNPSSIEAECQEESNGDTSAQQENWKDPSVQRLAIFWFQCMDRA